MPRNGSGGYDLPVNSWNPAINGVAATSTDYQTLIDDVESAIRQSVSADGQTPITGDFNFGGNALLNFTASSDLISQVSDAAGAVTTTVKEVANRTVHLFDFCTAAQKADILAKTMALDCSAPLQALWDACSSTVEYGAPKGILPPGRIKKTTALICKKQYINIEGAGMYQTQIVTSGAGVDGMTTSAINYLRPVMSNFAFVGDATTGYGINLSTVTIQVYLGLFENMYLQSGLDAFYAPRFFSMAMDTISAYSYAGHCFRIACGPAVTLRNLYALTCGLGKAGYRLRGSINMYGCNGLNEGDNWGVFGNDLASADGFQGDFADADLPAIYLEGCNLERFGSLSVNGIAVRVQNAYRSFDAVNCKLDRADLATAYKAMIYCRLGPNASGEPVRLGFSTIFKGIGVPSDAHLYSPSGGCTFIDTNNAFTSAGITTFKNAELVYPLARLFVVSDIFNDTAVKANALTARRITVEMMRFKELSVTPSGAGQDIDITGHTKILCTPPIATSINRLTFSQTPGTADDYLRNGIVYIEAMNANTTLNHNFGAANGMRLTGGANLTMALGQVVGFMRSANYLAATVGWVQI